MEQNMVIITMRDPLTNARSATARIRRRQPYAGGAAKDLTAELAEVEIRWPNGQTQKEATAFLLLNDRAEAIRAGVASITSCDTITGVAVMRPNGACTCFGATQGNESACNARLFQLRQTGIAQRAPQEEISAAEKGAAVPAAEIRVHAQERPVAAEAGAESLPPQPEPDGSVIAPSTRYRAVLGQEPAPAAQEAAAQTPMQEAPAQQSAPEAAPAREQASREKKPSAETLAMVAELPQNRPANRSAQNMRRMRQSSSPRYTSVPAARQMPSSARKQPAAPTPPVQTLPAPAAQPVSPPVFSQRENRPAGMLEQDGGAELLRPAGAQTTPAMTESGTGERQAPPIETAQTAGEELAFPELQEEELQLRPAGSIALQNILRRAKTLFPDPDEWGGFEAQSYSLNDHNTPQDHAGSQRCTNPFPHHFPGSTWMRVQRASLHEYYFEGRMRRGEENCIITAVPGDYSPVPPPHLQSFGRFIQTRSGGFWVRVETEE